MKKKFFQLIPILVIFIASTGYSYVKKSHNRTPEAQASSEYCDTCRRCESCKPRCEPCRACETCRPKPCCEPCRPMCEPCRACEICPPCEPYKPCCTEVPMTGEPCNCAYNAPARIDPACGWDAWISGSFIYWQPKESGIYLGYHNYRDDSSLMQVDTLNLDFDYQPGFKIGTGLSFCRDDWTLYLEYTRLKCKEHSSEDISDSFNRDSNSLIIFAMFSSGSGESGGPFNSVNANALSGTWKLDYNMFDLELGRPYYLGRKLIFKPHFGLRSGWINQDYKQKISTYQLFDQNPPYFINAIQAGDQDTWLIGPRTGLDTDWLLSCNFRIFGNAAASLTYQHFKTALTSDAPEQADQNNDRSIIVRNVFSRITPNAELAIGLGYGSYFCNSEWYFDMAVGYDFHFFWNQNGITLISNLLESETGSLILHGLTITARLDF